MIYQWSDSGLVTVEALVRWSDALPGFLDPSVEIDIAKQLKISSDASSDSSDIQADLLSMVAASATADSALTEIDGSFSGESQVESGSLAQSESSVIDSDLIQYLFCASSSESSTAEITTTLYNSVADDFGAYTVDEQPPGWTNFWNATGFTYTVRNSTPFTSPLHDNYLDINSSATTKKVITNDAMGVVNDVDIIARFRYTGDALDAPYYGPRVYARVSGTAGAENAYYLQLSEAYIKIKRYLNGADADRATKIVDTEAPANIIWMRFQVKGTALKGKIWQGNAIEPVDWMVQYTDTALTTGRVGIGAYDSTSDFQCDFFGVSEGVDVKYPDSFIPTEFGIFEQPAEIKYVTSPIFIGGLFPSTPKNLTGISVRIDSLHNEQLRLAVYSGGTLESPDGATLLHDFGVTTGTLRYGWLEASGANVVIPPNQPLWACCKADAGGTTIGYGGYTGQAGNFQIARGGYTVTGGQIESNENTPWPENVPVTTGNFTDEWYSFKIIFKEPELSVSSEAVSEISTISASGAANTSALSAAESLSVNIDAITSDGWPMAESWAISSISAVETLYRCVVTAASDTQSAISSPEAVEQIAVVAISTAESATSVVDGFNYEQLNAASVASSITSPVLAVARLAIATISAETSATSAVSTTKASIITSISSGPTTETSDVEASVFLATVATSAASSVTSGPGSTSHTALSCSSTVYSLAGSVNAKVTSGAVAATNAATNVSAIEVVASEHQSITALSIAASLTSNISGLVTCDLYTGSDAYTWTVGTASAALCDLSVESAATTVCRAITPLVRQSITVATDGAFMRKAPVVSFVRHLDS